MGCHQKKKVIKAIRLCFRVCYAC